jgi:hypothetical protein
MRPISACFAESSNDETSVVEPCDFVVDPKLVWVPDRLGTAKAHVATCLPNPESDETKISLRRRLLAVPIAKPSWSAFFP